MISTAGIAATAKWFSPIVSTVILPAHAQMSFCTDADVVGIWEIDNLTEIRTDVVDLFEGGTGQLLDKETGLPEEDDASVTWELEEDSTLSITFTQIGGYESIQFTGALKPPCNQVTGTLLPYEHNFIARKRS